LNIKLITFRPDSTLPLPYGNHRIWLLLSHYAI